MTASGLDQLLCDQWKTSVCSCRDSLERDDLRQVAFFHSWDDIQKQILRAQDDPSRQAVHQEFALLMPRLLQLRTFIDLFSHQTTPHLDTSVFWGLVGLVIKLVQDQDGAITPIPRMLHELCHKVEIFNNYCSDGQGLTPQIRESCLEISRELLLFLSYTVAFIRSDVQYSSPGTTLSSQWEPLSQRFTASTWEIDNSLAYIEKLFKFTNRTHQMDDIMRNMRLSHSPPDPPPAAIASPQIEQGRLPCVILPAIRTSRFFDRIDVIERIEEYFQKEDPNRSFYSLALYGLGGVGKSSIALKYAEAKLQRNELDALFWVQSEKLVTLRQSFTDIAVRLMLPGARPEDHDKNHALVLDWLMHTQCRWLIVYDNAENIDLLRAYWPAANRGQAIVTTRNHSFAFEPTNGGLEIRTWDTETGSRFLLHLLTTDISTELTAEDAYSANQLSQKLSGHALAISHMAGLIHRRAWSIAEFLNMYNQHPAEIHGVSGNSSINTLWDFAFKSLDSQSCAILGVLCFVSPDSIPQSIFEPGVSFDLPESLSFCSDHLRFSEVVENLLTLALVKRDKATRTFSLHRLVQTSFKYFMTPEQRQRSFDDASVLLSFGFPRRDSAVAQLYLMWERCAELLQHVISLKDCFREEKKSNPGFKALQTYCELNNACQRYLLEINAYTELEDLIQVNTMALSTLTPEERTCELQAALTSHNGQLLVRLGRASEGVEWLRKSYAINLQEVPPIPQEMAWGAENAANGIATINQFPEAIQLHERASDHWLEWSNQQVENKGSQSAVLMKSMGSTLIWAGQSKRARDVVTRALQQIESAEPYNWAMAAYTHFALGTVDRHDREFESAEAHFMEAQNLWLKGEQLRTDPFNSACMYRMGCAALDQGKVEAAIKHLRDAMVVTEIRKASMAAEHARCLFKLSEALEQEPRDIAQASKFREEAQRLLYKLAPKTPDAGLESAYDAQVNILWR